MRKVTEKLEMESPEVLIQLRKAVRTIYGAANPDLEQEAFLRTLAAFRRTPSIEHPRALMWKIVRDTVADYWRTRMRSRCDSVESVPEHLMTSHPDFEGELDYQKRQMWLQDAILSLGCEIRGPIYLFYIEGYSIRTIARIYEKTPSAIKMALHRGRQRLSIKCSRPARLTSRV